MPTKTPIEPDENRRADRGVFNEAPCASNLWQAGGDGDEQQTEVEIAARVQGLGLLLRRRFPSGHHPHGPR
jgi:hypothetical protein